MKGYVQNIEQLTLENEAFRHVLYTDERIQLVVMSLNPQEDIGEEVHQLDQFIRIEEGTGKAILDGEEHIITDGSVVIVPVGVRHNIINTATDEQLKLYTLYAPPSHRDGLLQQVKPAAEKPEDEYKKP